MKYIITTDTHLGRSNSGEFELNQTLDLFTEIVSYSHENNIKEFIHLGDFFDNRKQLSINTLNYACKIADLLNDNLTTHLILGNHDIHHKDKLYPYSPVMFKDKPNIHVITEPTVLTDILLLPWFFNKIDLDSHCEYCMGHFEMNGPIINKSGTISEGYSLNISDFSDFKLVLSGHYHTPGKYENVKYIGSPYHQNFNDSGERGFYVFEDGDLTFIPYNTSKYCVVNAEDGFTKENIEGNSIRLEFYNNLGDIEIERITNLVSSYNPLKLKPIYYFSSGLTEEERDVDLCDISDNEDILYKFIENSETHLNKVKLKSMIKDIQE